MAHRPASSVFPERGSARPGEEAQPEDAETGGRTEGREDPEPEDDGGLVGEQSYNYNTRFNACLLITNLGGNMYRVHIGLDVNVGQQEAQNIINAGSRPTAALYGDDGAPSVDDFLTTLPLKMGFPVAGAAG